MFLSTGKPVNRPVGPMVLLQILGVYALGKKTMFENVQKSYILIQMLLQK
jgi:hypothetical protein